MAHNTAVYAVKMLLDVGYRLSCQGIQTIYVLTA